jgi:hypothetical protein
LCVCWGGRARRAGWCLGTVHTQSLVPRMGKGLGSGVYYNSIRTRARQCNGQAPARKRSSVARGMRVSQQCLHARGRGGHARGLRLYAAAVVQLELEYAGSTR